MTKSTKKKKSTKEKKVNMRANALKNKIIAATKKKKNKRTVYERILRNCDRMVKERKEKSIPLHKLK
jgi:hypothetical protein